MPLKHSTETALVFFLALAIVVTGVIAAVLPPLPGGIVVWAVVFGLSLLYPLALYPLLKGSRADYSFRLLHYVPAIILASWLVLQLLGFYVPALGILSRAFTWGWTLPAVAVGILLLVIFCLQVLRQRDTRIALLLTLFLPIVALGLVAEQYDWNNRLASSLWNGWTSSGGTLVAMSSSSMAMSSSSEAVHPTVAMSSASSTSSSRASSVSSRIPSVAVVTSSVSSSSSSVSSASSAMMSSVSSAMTASGTGSSRGWFAWIRELFMDEPKAGTGSAVGGPDVVAALSGATVAHQQTGSSLAAASTSSRGSTVKKPSHLTQSGPGEVGLLGLLLLAGYCGTLQLRSRARRA